MPILMQSGLVLMLGPSMEIRGMVFACFYLLDMLKIHIMVGVANSLLIRYALTEGDVTLGLKRDIPSEELLALVNAQDIETLLGLMHRVHVKPHQVTCPHHPSS